MNRCEICEVELQNGDWICGGLDVPESGFCRKHKKAHAKYCVDLERGRSQWWMIGAEDKREARRELEGKCTVILIGLVFLRVLF